MKHIFRYLSILLITIFISSCSRVHNKEEETILYKSNLSINTKYDEMNYCINGDNIYVLARYKINGKEYYEVIKSKLVNNNTSNISVFNQKFGNLTPENPPSIHQSQTTGLEEYYFIAKECEDCMRKLFYSFKVSDTIYSEPKSIEFENKYIKNISNISLSKDGKMIAFSAEDSTKNKNIYISKKNENEIWTEPVRLNEKVNSEYDEDYPNFTQNNELYYSSKSSSKGDNYDIHKAIINNKTTEVVETKKLPVVNTEYNEISYQEYGDKAIYSSDRNKNYDIFIENKCLKAKLNLVFNGTKEAINNTKIVLKSEFGEVLYNNYAQNKNFSLELEQDKKYTLKVSNLCYDNFEFDKVLDIPCDNTENLNYNYTFNIQEIKYTYEFEETNVPYFVTGYYHPNTIKNLNELRLLFKQNRFGSDSTNYIEQPTAKYDTYAEEIEASFASMKNFIEDKLIAMDNKCFNNENYLRISITGYADIRTIANGMKYFGPSIEDKSVGLKIKNGDTFNNLQLSKLRAYYTAEEIKNLMLTIPEYNKFKDKIVWNINGKGEILNRNANLDLSRRVIIKIESIPYENN